MATKKVYKKDKLVTSIDDILSKTNRPLIIIHPNKQIPIEYNKLKTMALSSVVSLIEDKKLYYAIIVIEETVRKIKPKVMAKEKSNITGCKATLDNIYGND